jgi:GNAT superfamily N-acetyltransferase
MERRIEVVDAQTARRHFDDLCALLTEAVGDGALVGYVLPMKVDAASDYWSGVMHSLEGSERLLFCAFVDEQLVGTVQLYLSPEPNAPHRAEVYKLLVRRDARENGIGRALMLALEEEALRRGRTLLLLDTVLGGAGERLYRSLGWQEVGIVPKHFVDPFGAPKSSIYFMRHLADQARGFDAEPSITRHLDQA